MDRTASLVRRTTWIPPVVVLAAGLIALLAPTRSTGEESRVFEARRVIPSAGIEVKEQKGRFVVDVVAHELRFVHDGQVRVSISEGEIVALHYESKTNAGQPAGNGYLTIHSGRDPQTSRTASIRFRREDVETILAQLTADTGLSIDRSEPHRSFLGIPIRAELGDQVEVRASSDAVVRGRLVGIAPASIEIVDRDALRHTLDSVSVLRIEHYVDRSGKAAKAFGRGFALALGLAVGAYAALASGFGGEGGITGGEVAAIIGVAAMVGAVSAATTSLDIENSASVRVIFAR